MTAPSMIAPTNCLRHTIGTTEFPFGSGIATPPTPGPAHYNSIDPAYANPIDVQGERLKVVEEARKFAETKDILVKVIDDCDSLLDDLKRFSSIWLLRYPTIDEEAGILTSPSAPNGGPLPPHLRHSAPEVQEASNLIEQRPVLHAPFQSLGSGPSSIDGRLQVLSIDPFGGKAKTMPSAAAITADLTHETRAAMLCTQVGSVRRHLGDLRTRLLDGSARILITGDLNAGKSTFVNALLRRPVAPVDQQPCTEVMCEIIHAGANGGVEEIHAVCRGVHYDTSNCATFTRFPLEELETLVVLSEEDDAPSDRAVFDILKVYLKDAAASPLASGATSLLRNGDISVSFIDAPGLNRDTVSTTALFAKHSTIDVIVFVVSSENQFTLSGQEFLWAASQEKAYVFVVVNKWDAISNKVRAERRVREQIRKLSSTTWERRQELLHFVDSQAVLSTNPRSDHPAFDHLERCLSSFVLHKRFASKLQPAHTYADKLLRDLRLISEVNAIACAEQLAEADRRLQRISPVCQCLQTARQVMERGINTVEEGTVDDVHRMTSRRLRDTLSKVAEGYMGEEGPQYRGILDIWSYADKVQRALAAVLEAEVEAAEGHVRSVTSSAVIRIRDELGSNSLLDRVPPPDRVFRPEVMFSRRQRSSISSHPFAAGVGLQLTEATQVRFLDLFDLERFVDIARRVTKPANEDSALGVVGGVGIGSLALFGTGAAGGKALVDSVVRLCEVLGSPKARKWAGVVVVIATAGLGAYLIADLPRAVPRNMGRRLQKTLDEAQPSGSWSDEEARRISRETRKVLRLAGWDVRGRFRTALEKAEAEQVRAQQLKNTALQAESWLDDFTSRIRQVAIKVDSIVPFD